MNQHLPCSMCPKRKYIQRVAEICGVGKVHRRLGSASPSMDFTDPTNFFKQSVAPQAMTMTHVPPPYEDYTGRALFALFCCCWPLGLWALLKASEAKKSYQMGDSETARSQADQARQWINISIVVGGLSFALTFIFITMFALYAIIKGHETDAPSTEFNLQKE
uniref:Uncharacterized protein n=1 Tax=Magallana gigas TaxID=29159 RepID=K1PHY4_MAGGI